MNLSTIQSTHRVEAAARSSSLTPQAPSPKPVLPTSDFPLPTSGKPQASSLKPLLLALVLALLLPAAALAGPLGAEGDVYVITGSEVSQFDGQTGALVGVFASGGGLDSPRGITFGPNGNLFLTNPNSNEVLEFDGATGAPVGAFASGGGLSSPKGLTFGPNGNLFVASSGGNKVIEYDGVNGTLVGTFASGGGLSAPRGLTFGPNGNLFVASASSDNVIEYDGVSGALVGVFASGGGLDQPIGLAFVGPGGNLFVAGASNREVVEYDGATGALVGIFASGGGLDVPNDPQGLRFGPDGNLFVSSYRPGGGSVVELDGAGGAEVGSLSATSTKSLAFKPLGGPFPTPVLGGLAPTQADDCGLLAGATVSGTGLAWGAQLSLTRPGEPTLFGSSLVVLSDTQITANFNLTNAAAGLWDMELTYPDGQSAMLAGALEVVALCATPLVTGFSPAQTDTCGPLAGAVITGDNFLAGATVSLTLIGQPDIVGSNVNVASLTTITADFDVSAAVGGLWDVVVVNAGGGLPGTLPGGLDISVCQPVITLVNPQRAIYPVLSGGELRIHVHGTNLWLSGEFPAATAVVLRRDGVPDLTMEQGSSSGTAASGILLSKPTSNGLQAIPGLYDLVLTRTDGGTTTVPDAIEILADSGRRVELVGAWGGSVEAIHVDGAANLAYVGIGQTMHIFDVSGPGDPVELGSLWLPSVMLYDIKVRDGLAYIGGVDSADQNGSSQWFGVVDVSDPASPMLLSSLNTSNGAHHTITLSDDGLTVYTGSSQAVARAFDVSDPANPVYLGPMSGFVGNHVIRGDDLYWAIDDYRSVLVGVCDLTIPGPCASPYIEIVVGARMGPDVGVALSGDYLYVTARFHSNDAPLHSEIFVIDVSDPAAPLHVGTWNAGGAIDNFEFGSSMTISGGRLYWAGSWNTAPTDPTRRTMVIFDIATDPTAPALIGEYVSDASFQEIEVVGTTAYLGDRREGFTIVDCADPANPVRVGNFYSPSRFMRAVQSGDTLYVTDWLYGVTALDVSDPTAPALLGKWETGPGWDVPGQDLISNTWPAANWGIDAAGDLVYIAAGWNGVQVVDFADPANPVLVGDVAFPLRTRAMGLELRGQLLKVHLYSININIQPAFINYDVSDPQAIAEIGSTLYGAGATVSDFATHASGAVFAAESGATSYHVLDNADPNNPVWIQIFGARDNAVALDGNLLYIADGWVNDASGPVSNSLSSLRILDVTVPYGPQVDVGLFEKGTGSSTSNAVAIAGDLAFVARDGGILRMLDISDPASPFLLHTAPTALAPIVELLANPPYLYALGQPGGVLETSPGVLVYRFYTLGDFDADGAVGANDLGTFVACLLGTDPDPAHALIADLNEDGTADGLDIPLFVAMLLDPPPPPVWGSCCLPDGACAEDVTEPNCLYTLGGQYNGDNISCAAVICPPVGACCLPFGSVTCDERTAFACAAVGGAYQGDFTTCVTTLCPFGACCFIDDGSCLDRSPASCAALAGDYRGDGTDCASTVCPFGQYSNEVSPITQVALAGAGLQIADDMTLAGIGARDLVSLDLAVFGGNAGGGPFDVTVTLYDACPGAGGTAIPNTTFNWFAIPDDGFVYILFVDPVTPAVTIPDTVWMVATFSTTQSGWIIAEQAEVGTTADVYARDNPWTCNNNFGGAPHAGLWANLICIEGSARAANPEGPGSPTEPTLRMIKLEAEMPPTLQTLGGE